MIGATLGGGVGRYNGLHGMILDSLRSVRIVTASGEIITASTTENPDLFWGIRGAGFNYGIVLSAVYQVYDLTSKKVMNADMVFPASYNATILKYLKSYETNMPAKLAIILLGGYNEAYGGVSYRVLHDSSGLVLNICHHQQYIVINAAYAGSLVEGTALIQPLIDLHPIRQNITQVPWKDLVSASLFAAEGSLPNPCVKGGHQNIYGGSIKTYDISTFQNFMANLETFYHSYPNARGSTWFIEHFANQAVKAVPADETAYPWRDITAHLFVLSTSSAFPAPLSMYILIKSNMTNLSPFVNEQTVRLRIQ